MSEMRKNQRIRISQERKKLHALYADAASLLYGVISLHDFVEVFNHYEDVKTDVEHARSALLKYEHSNPDEVMYELVKKHIIGPDLYVFDERDFEKVAVPILEQQAGKKRYLPNKEEFIKFADSDYINPEKPYNDLRAYILGKRYAREGLYGVDGDLLQLRELIRFEAEMSEILEYFDDEGYPLSNIEKINEFTQMLVYVQDNTRRFENNGFTPNEMVGEPIRMPVFQNSLTTIGKVGRNEKCPCGSGKKYKKCCYDKDRTAPNSDTYSEIESYEQNNIIDIRDFQNKEINFEQQDEFDRMDEENLLEMFKDIKNQAFEETLQSLLDEHGEDALNDIEEDLMQMLYEMQIHREEQISKTALGKAYFDACKVLSEVCDSIKKYVESGKYLPFSLEDQSFNSIAIMTNNIANSEEQENRFYFDEAFSMNAFYEFITYFPVFNNISPIDEFVSGNRLRRADKVAMLQSMSESKLGLFKVVKYDYETGITQLQDVQTGEMHEILDPGISAGLLPDLEYTFTRLIKYDGSEINSGLNILFDKDDEFIKANLKRYKKDFDSNNADFWFLEFYNNFMEREMEIVDFESANEIIDEKEPKKKQAGDGKRGSLVLSVSAGTGCYRHIQISESASLQNLSSAILDSVDFYDDHMHAFFMNNRIWDSAFEYICPVGGLDGARGYSDKARLSKFDLDVGDKFLYVFDFGDEWRFQIKVLQVSEEVTETPIVLKSVGEIKQYG